MRKILVCTDYEPDDLLALTILNYTYRNDQITIVVSENEETVRREKAFDVAHLFPGAKVMLGQGSDKKYAFQHNPQAKPVHLPVFFDGHVLPEKPDVVFGLAPPRDLIDVSLKDPHFFEQAEAWFYGGFNFAILGMHDNYFDFSRWLESAFKSAVVFQTQESFGDGKTFREHTGPLIPALLENADKHPALARLRQLSYNWDKHIRDKQQAKAEAILANYPQLFGAEIDVPGKHEEYMRILKEHPDAKTDPELFSAHKTLVVYEATKDLKFQMVAADPTVAIMADMCLSSKDLKQVRFIPGKIFRYEPCPGSRLFLFDPEDKKAAHDEVETNISVLIHEMVNE